VYVVGGGGVDLSVSGNRSHLQRQRQGGYTMPGIKKILEAFNQHLLKYTETARATKDQCTRCGISMEEYNKNLYLLDTGLDVLRKKILETQVFSAELHSRLDKLDNQYGDDILGG
jgi:hypothetical protein